jgi:hypothetical protein
MLRTERGPALQANRGHNVYAAVERDSLQQLRLREAIDDRKKDGAAYAVRCRRSNACIGRGLICNIFVCAAAIYVGRKEGRKEEQHARSGGGK